MRREALGLGAALGLIGAPLLLLERRLQVDVRNVLQPTLLEEAEISEEDRVYFEPRMKEILKFLLKNVSSGSYFLSDYEEAEKAYTRAFESSCNAKEALSGSALA